MKKITLVFLVVFSLAWVGFSLSAEASDKEGMVVVERYYDHPYSYPARDLFLFDDNVRPGYYRDGYYYGRYYFHYPKEEKSPYENLRVRPAGELKVTVKPAKAKVLVDGYSLKPSEDLSYKIGLLTGKHRVEVQAEGFTPYVEEVEIQQGEKKVLSIELKK